MKMYRFSLETREMFYWITCSDPHAKMVYWNFSRAVLFQAAEEYLPRNFTKNDKSPNLVFLIQCKDTFLEMSNLKGKG